MGENWVELVLFPYARRLMSVVSEISLGNRLDNPTRFEQFSISFDANQLKINTNPNDSELIRTRVNLNRISNPDQ